MSRFAVGWVLCALCVGFALAKPIRKHKSAAKLIVKRWDLFVNQDREYNDFFSLTQGLRLLRVLPYMKLHVSVLILEEFLVYRFLSTSSLVFGLLN